MHRSTKIAACLTLSCLLWPQPMAWADEASDASASALPYRSQVVINTTAYSPAARPLSIGGQIYLPLRWTMETLGAPDVLWTPAEDASYQAAIRVTAPSYFLLQQYHSLIKGLTVDGNDLQHTLPPQLYRISLPPSPLKEDNALRRTPVPLRLEIADGDRTYTQDVYDYLLVDGQYYLSGYWFNQLFGADLTDEARTDTVSVAAPSSEHWQQSLDALQKQLACSEPQEAAELWIMAQEKQSGGLQYALLSLDLRQQAYAQAAAAGSWLTSDGSSRFGQASITDENRLSSNKVLYTIQFSEMLGDSPNKTQRQQITVERLSGTWQITAVTGDTDYYTLLPSAK